MKNAIVVIPTYNEVNTIGELIESILRLCSSIAILVVDDNSCDGTRAIVEYFVKKYSNIHLISRPKKLGLGSAYRDGFKFALDNNFSYILEIDADLSHMPQDIKVFLEKSKNGIDLVIGSRYKNGFRVKGWSVFRMTLSYFANIFARVVLGFDIYDSTSGFRCFRAAALKEVMKHSKAEGFVFQIEIAYLFWHKKLKIEEVPIVFIERKYGKSKCDIIIIMEAFLKILKLKFFQE